MPDFARPMVREQDRLPIDPLMVMFQLHVGEQHRQEGHGKQRSDKSLHYTPLPLSEWFVSLMPL